MFPCMITSNSPKDFGKLASAEHAVKTFITKSSKNLIVGIGSGSTIVHVIELIAKRYSQEEELKLICIPSSFQAKHMIIQLGLPLGDLEMYPCLDVTIDGADEVDTNLNLIKGGGGCMTMEKILARNSKKYVIVVDESKSSSFLGEKWKKGIPIEVIPSSHICVSRELKTMGYDAVLRLAVNKAGPVVTDNGGFILDLKFDPSDKINWEVENSKIKMIPGVVETGLFIKMANFVIFGKSDQTSTIISRISM